MRELLPPAAAAVAAVVMVWRGLCCGVLIALSTPLSPLEHTWLTNLWEWREGEGGGEGGRGDGVRGGSEWRELLYTYAKASRVSGVYIISQ